MTYLDHNATTPLKPAVKAAMVEALEIGGNPSSVHRYGRMARRTMDEARAAVAGLMGVKPAQVIFTSGGTEANALALQGIKAASTITSSIEHDAVLANSVDALRLPVTRDGVVDLAEAAEMLKAAPAGSLVSVMMVNNETGVIQPVAEIAQLAKKYGHFMHTDAVQAIGRLRVMFNELGVDALSLSAHKIGGPQGIGALIVSEKLPLQAQQRGGGQEMNRRAGTENVAAIAGFGMAASLAAADMRDMPRLGALRDRMQNELMRLGGGAVMVAGLNAPRVATTFSIAMRGVSGETQVAAMDLAGVAVSAGSACSSGKVKASHVLRAMGYGDDVAGCALRMSLGWTTTEQDIETAVAAWNALFRRVAQPAHAA